MLKLNNTLKNISIVTGGNFFNAVLGFISIVLVSRYLGPEKFGIFSVVFGFFTLLSKFGDLGSNATLMRYISYFRIKKDVESEKKVIGFGLGLTYLFIFLSLIVLVPFYQTISSFLNISDYSFYLLFAIIFSFGFILFNTYNVFLQALEKFNYYLYSYSLTSLFKVFVIVALIVVANTTIFNFLIAYLIAPLIGYLVSRFYFKKLVGYQIKPNLKKDSLRLVTPFLFFMGVASISGAIGEQLGVFISSIIFTPYEVGLYSAAARFSIVFSLIVGSIGTVLLPRASRYENLDDITRFAKKALLLGTFLVLFIVPVVAFPEFFLTITAGEKYLGAAKLLSILAISGGLSFITGSFSAVFYSLNKPSYFAAISLFGLFVELPLTYFLGTKIGLEGLVYAKLIMAVIILFTSLIYFLFSSKIFSKKQEFLEPILESRRVE